MAASWNRALAGSASRRDVERHGRARRARRAGPGPGAPCARRPPVPRSPSSPISGCGQVLDLGPGVGVVVEPLDDPDPPRPDRVEADQAAVVEPGVDDRRHRPDVEPEVAAADLRAPLDEHHAELAVAVEAVDRQLAVAGLEHLERERDVREVDDAQREHGPPRVHGLRCQRDRASAPAGTTPGRWRRRSSIGGRRRGRTPPR